MHKLYGLRDGRPRRLVATFGSEQQLLAYVRWATLVDAGGQRGKFEQGSALSGFDAWERTTEAGADENAHEVVHNPTPSML